jgi:DNA-binding transcriptional regulator YiaG
MKTLVIKTLLKVYPQLGRALLMRWAKQDIRECRKAFGISQRKLAASSGIAVSTLSALERHTRKSYKSTKQAATHGLIRLVE